MIRYMLKTTMIGLREFPRVKKELEGGIDYKDKIKMSFGNTQNQRFEFISGNLLKFYRENLQTVKYNSYY